MVTELSIVIPAYNEEEAISSWYEEMVKFLGLIDINHEILIVDDGSTDRTAEIANKLKDARLIRHQVNRGYGAALKTGIAEATGNFVLIIDADGTYPAAEIPRLVSLMTNYDMVVGARTGQSVVIPLYRRPAKWFLSHLANYLSGTNIPDLNSGMRIFKRQVARRYFGILPNGFSFTTTITLAYHSDGLAVKYVPINYRRRAGSSKIKPFRDGFNFILLIVRSITYFNPLKVFIPVASGLLLASIFIAIYSILILGRFMDVTTLILIIAAFQTGMFGMLADVVVRSRNYESR